MKIRSISLVIRKVKIKITQSLEKSKRWQYYPMVEVELFENSDFDGRHIN